MRQMRAKIIEQLESEKTTFVSLGKTYVVVCPDNQAIDRCIRVVMRCMKRNAVNDG